MPLINETRLLNFVDGDRDSVVELAAAFLGSVPMELDKARLAATQGDLKQVAFSIHKLKSSVTIFHDGPTTKKLGELEIRARSGDGTTVELDLQTIDAVVRELLEEVKKLVNRT